jgi:hypothetical protein
MPIDSNREVSRLESVRRAGILSTFALAPWMWIRSCTAWVLSWFGDRSAKTAKEKDDARQSRVRRTLRGLPAEHVQRDSDQTKGDHE